MKIGSNLNMLLPTTASKIASKQGTGSIKFSLPDHVKIADPVALSNEGKVQRKQAMENQREQLHKITGSGQQYRIRKMQRHLHMTWHM
jgi:hypothetical protein